MIPADKLTPEIVSQLSEFLAAPERPEGTLSYTKLRGYLFSIAHSPRMVMPSAWLPRVFGEEEVTWDDEAQVQKIYGWLMAVFADIGQASDEEDEIRTAWLFGLEMAAEADAAAGAGTATDTATTASVSPADDDTRREWSAGFHLGWEAVQNSWAEAADILDEENAKRLGLCLLSLRYFSDPSGFDARWEIPEDEREDWSEKMNDLFPMAAGFYCRLGKVLYMRSLEQSSQASRPQGTIHVEKGPGRNDPCPCGSGKKYKKCCLN